MSRLKDIYLNKVLPELRQEFGTNLMAAPKLVKVVLNVGTGQGRSNPKMAETVQETLKIISGQKPAVRLARKAISGFKVRAGEEVGYTVTLRGEKMYDFLDRLANIAFPRMRDFRGLNPESFDKNGNYTLGIKENIIFPEIPHEKMETAHGLEVTIVTNTESKEQARKLIELLGFPFYKEGR